MAHIALYGTGQASPLMGLNPRRDRRKVAENIEVKEGGDCPRCGGAKTHSSIPGYLACSRCSYEWKDPDFSPVGSGSDRASVSHDSALIEQFKTELESGGEISRVLGIDQQLTSEQEGALTRLQGKWVDGMHGHYDPARDERKPLIIAFDEDDNLLQTEVASLTVVNNDFDGGEEVRIEYPGIGTEFFGFDDDDANGWRRGRTAEKTARNIATVINRNSKLVHAHHDGACVSFELRDSRMNPASLVLYIDDPGGKDLIGEKGGVSLDPDDVTVEEDYTAAVALMLEDGIITPSEDQLLWAMRQNLGISDKRHIRIITSLFGNSALKECHGCGGNAPFLEQQGGWYCDKCRIWL